MGIEEIPKASMEGLAEKIEQETALLKENVAELEVNFEFLRGLGDFGKDKLEEYAEGIRQVYNSYECVKKILDTTILASLSLMTSSSGVALYELIEHNILVSDMFQGDARASISMAGASAIVALIACAGKVANWLREYPLSSRF